MKKLVFAALLVVAVVVLVMATMAIAAERIQSWQVTVDSATVCGAGGAGDSGIVAYLTPKNGFVINDMSRGFEWWVAPIDSGTTCRGHTADDTLTVVMQTAALKSDWWHDVRGENDTLNMAGALGTKTALYYGSGYLAKRLTKGLGASYPADTVAVLDLYSKVRWVLKNAKTTLTDTVGVGDGPTTYETTVREF